MEATMTSRIIIRGTIAILIQREAVARKVQARFKERGMDADILKENNPRFDEFLKKGRGLLITDTYLGFRPVRVLKDSKNTQICVVFLRRPADSFEESTLLDFGTMVVGVYEEEMEDEHLSELIMRAIKFESEVDPGILIEDDE